MQQHADGLALQLAHIYLESSSFITIFSPYIRMCVLAFRGLVGACVCFACPPSARAARYSYSCVYVGLCIRTCVARSLVLGVRFSWLETPMCVCVWVCDFAILFLFLFLFLFIFLVFSLSFLLSFMFSLSLVLLTFSSFLLSFLLSKYVQSFLEKKRDPGIRAQLKCT